MTLSREELWEQLYERLLEALCTSGKNDPSADDADYWLIDDDWGGHHHKICVANSRFWSDAVEIKIRRVLAESFTDWGVFVVFEDKSGRPGFIVYADGTQRDRRWP